MMKRWIQAMGSDQTRMRNLTYDEAVEAAMKWRKGIRQTHNAQHS